MCVCVCVCVSVRVRRLGPNQIRTHTIFLAVFKLHTCFCVHMSVWTEPELIHVHTPSLTISLPFAHNHSRALTHGLSPLSHARVHRYRRRHRRRHRHRHRHRHRLRFSQYVTRLMTQPTYIYTYIYIYMHKYLYTNT